MDDLELLAIQAVTRFELTPSGRLLCERSPDRTPAPRMWLAASASGNLVRLREDVDEETAHAIEALAAREPPLLDPERRPVYLDEYARPLGGATTRGVTYLLPASLRYDHAASVVSSESRAGARLFADGMPDELIELGFTDASELWPPWCAALEGGNVVSVAFTARLSPVGAEAGVATPPAFRGRGFASAATAAWASVPSLRGRVLFYSTDTANASSRRVVERLRLPLVGASVSVR